MPFGPVPNLLGRTEMAATAASSDVVPFPGAKYLTIAACVTGYSSGGIFSFRFGISGGAIDTGTRYRTLISAAPTASAGTAWIAAVAATSDTMLRLADTAKTTGRLAWVEIMNRNTTEHGVQFWTTDLSASVTTHGRRMFGEGVYLSATAGLITSCQMVSTGGSLLAGTGFEVYGYL